MTWLDGGVVLVSCQHLDVSYIYIQMCERLRSIVFTRYSLINSLPFDSKLFAIMSFIIMDTQLIEMFQMVNR